jgi:hypothetical protein
MDLIDPADPLRPYVTLTNGIDINDAGQILARGCDNRETVCRAYVATPFVRIPGETPVGSGVVVSPVVTLPNGTSTTVGLMFDLVQSAGTTTVTASAPGGGTSGPPTGFKVGSPPVYYDVSTTANFSGSVTLCFHWIEGQFHNEDNVRVFHGESGWQDVTIPASLDKSANRVCGTVTSLSPFALFESAYTFAGFYSPIDNLPIRNTVKAGSSIPVKFSLGGNHGLAIFAAGYPVSQSMTCTGSAPSDAVEEVVTTRNSGLSYDAGTGQYNYVWKTYKAWAKTCRRLVLQLIDGTEYRAEFEFLK